MRTETRNIFEILEYGPICAQDSELGLLVSVNGAYLNLWVGTPESGFENTDCRAMDKDLYETTGAQMIDLAEEYLKDVINEGRE